MPLPHPKRLLQHAPVLLHDRLRESVAPLDLFCHTENSRVRRCWNTPACSRAPVCGEYILAVVVLCAAGFKRFLGAVGVVACDWPICDGIYSCFWHRLRRVPRGALWYARVAALVLVCSVQGPKRVQPGFFWRRRCCYRGRFDASLPAGRSSVDTGVCRFSGNGGGCPRFFFWRLLPWNFMVATCLTNPLGGDIAALRICFLLQNSPPYTQCIDASEVKRYRGSRN